MNIEPVNSMMTYQAQVQTSKAAERPVMADTDVAAAGIERPVDMTTVTIKSTGETDAQQGQGSGAKEQQSQESVKKMVDQLNKKMNNSEAIFGIHEGTNRVTIKIIDKETKETIKEYPPEKTLDMIAKVWEMAGILVDEKR
ncbi:MAG: flagellar protein FlaG [Lachnospiraceae bacterium]|nr:flagellar protein FlaG [Lachnospiraceae bacterium]